MPKNQPYPEDDFSAHKPNALQELPSDDLRVNEEDEDEVRTDPLQIEGGETQQVAYEPEVTQKQWAAGRQNDPVIAAFVSEQLRLTGVRKLSQTAWDAEFKVFVDKERG